MNGYTILESCFLRATKDYVIPLLFIQECDEKGKTFGLAHWCTTVYGAYESVALTKKEIAMQFQRELRHKHFPQTTEEKIKRLMTSGFDNAKSLDDVVRNNNYENCKKPIALEVELIPFGSSASDVQIVYITRQDELDELVRTRRRDIESVRFSRDNRLHTYPRNKKDYRNAYYYTIAVNNNSLFLQKIVPPDSLIWCQYKNNIIKYAKRHAAEETAKKCIQILQSSTKNQYNDVCVIENGKYASLGMAKHPAQYLELYKTASESTLTYLNQLFYYLIRLMTAADQNVSKVFGKSYGPKTDYFLKNLMLLKKWESGEMDAHTLLQTIDMNMNLQEFQYEISGLLAVLRKH